MAMMLAPSISAWLLQSKGLAFVFLLDFATLTLASLVTLAMAIPQPPALRPHQQLEREKQSFASSVAATVR
jgi:hypothetical protein